MAARKEDLEEVKKFLKSGLIASEYAKQTGRSLTYVTDRANRVIREFRKGRIYDAKPLIGHSDNIREMAKEPLLWLQAIEEYEKAAEAIEQDYANPKKAETPTLRDYFAAKAMEGILSQENGLSNYANIADSAYRLADAMLKAREL